MRVLVIDNYDSFTYNLVQGLGELGAELEVLRNDAATLAELRAREPDRLVISPGPCTPADAGVSIEASRAFPEAGVPTLGVCLGHQAMVEAFGGRTIRGEPIHGKDAEIEHDGRGIFAGLESPVLAGRYHSLVADPDLPDGLELTASLGDVVMAVRHRELPAEGVQFHPESVLTPCGQRMLRNFLRADSSVSDRRHHELEVLAEVKRQVEAGTGRPWSDEGLVVHDLRLDGRYPDTKLIVDLERLGRRDELEWKLWDGDFGFKGEPVPPWAAAQEVLIQVWEW